MMRLAKWTVLVVSAFICFLPTVCRAQASLPAKWSFNPTIFISSIAFSPDGTLTAVAGNAGVCLYSSSTQLPYCGIAANVTVSSFAFSPDGTSVAVGGSNNQGYGVLQTWNVSTGKLIATFTTDATRINSVAFSADGSILVSGGINSDPYTNLSSGVLEVWSVPNQIKIKSLPTSAVSVNSVALSHDGLTLAAGGDNGQQSVLELWNVSNLSLLNRLSSSSATSISSVAISPDGTTLASGGAGTSGGVLQLWTIASGKLLSTLATQIDSPVFAVAFSPDGATLIDGGSSYGSSDGQEVGAGVLEQWNTSSFAEASTQMGYGWVVSAVAYSADGSKLAYAGTTYSWVGPWLGGSYEASGGYFDTQSLSGVEGRTITTTTNSPGAFPILGELPSFSRDGTMVAGGVPDSSISIPGGAIQAFNIWDVATGALKVPIPTMGMNGCSTAFSSDGKTLAVFGAIGSDTAVNLWNISTATLIATMHTGFQTAGAINYSPNGQLLAVEGNLSDGTPSIEIWNAATATLVETIAPATNRGTAVAFSPDGLSLAVGGAFQPSNYDLPSIGVLQIWDVATGELVTQFATSSTQLDGVAYSSDGSTLAASGWIESTPPIYSQLGTLELWNVASETLIAKTPLLSGTQYVYGSWFSLDGKTLYAATGGDTSELQVFDVGTNSLSGFFDLNYTSLAVSTDGSLLAALTQGGGLTLDAMTAVTSAKIQSVTLSSYQVQQNSSVIGTVTLKNPAPAGGITIALQATPSDSNAVFVTVPGTITIPAGAISGSFPVSASWANETTSVVIGAVSGAFTSSTNLIVLTPSLASLNFNSTTVVAGGMLTGTATLTAPAGLFGSFVTLTSSNPSVVVTPGATIVEEDNSTTFLVTTKPVSQRQTATITATAGTVTMSAVITVVPAVLESISLSPSSVAGRSSSTATIKLNAPAGPGGAVIKLSSSSQAAAVPAYVSVAAGKTSATVVVTTKAVRTRTTATITATSEGSKVTANLVVN